MSIRDFGALSDEDVERARKIVRASDSSGDFGSLFRRIWEDFASRHALPGGDVCGDIYVPTGAAAVGWTQGDSVRCAKQAGHGDFHVAKFEEDGDTFSVTWAKNKAPDAEFGEMLADFGDAAFEQGYAGAKDWIGDECRTWYEKRLAVRDRLTDWAAKLREELAAAQSLVAAMQKELAPSLDPNLNYEEGDSSVCRVARAVRALADALDADPAVGKTVDFPQVVENALRPRRTGNGTGNSGVRPVPNDGGSGEQSKPPRRSGGYGA